MKLKYLFISLMAAIGFGSTAMAADQPQHRFYDGGLMLPGENDPAYKKALYNATGTAFGVELGVGLWAIDNQAPSYNSDNAVGMLWAHVDQRLIKNDINGGTWLRVDMMGSWGLDDDTADRQRFFDGGFGSATWHNTDLFGPADFYVLNLTLKQYFYQKRVCFNGGIIWMSQYFDRISHARFANDAFEKSPVLPLVWQAPGAVVQVDVDQDNFATVALVGTGVPAGQNPFNFDNTIGYAVVGEWGHEFADDKGIWRVAPFFTSEDAATADGREKERNSVGLMTGVEYQVNDFAKVYGRLAWASSEYQRCRKEAMVGTTLRVVPSRPQDYLGVGFGLYKGADTDTKHLVNEFEKVLEFTYRVKINDNFSFAPYYQVYFNPAYRDVSTVSATGVQAHFSF
ncbi:MAG: carbohydrate porin [Akkermansia sp.]|nr:carbohydrate porin [Akkermansia sp.]